MMGDQVTWKATLPATGAGLAGTLILIITVLMATNGHEPYLAVGFFLVAITLLVVACCKSSLFTIQFVPDDEHNLSTANIFHEE